MAQQFAIKDSLPITTTVTDEYSLTNLATETVNYETDSRHYSDEYAVSTDATVTEPTNAPKTATLDIAGKYFSDATEAESADRAESANTDTTGTQSSDAAKTSFTLAAETMSIDTVAVTSTEATETTDASQTSTKLKPDNTTSWEETSQTSMITSKIEGTVEKMTTTESPEIIQSHNNDALLNESKTVFEEIEKMVNNGSISVEALLELNVLPDIKIYMNAESYIMNTLSKAYSVLDRAHRVEASSHRRSSDEEHGGRGKRSADNSCQLSETCTDVNGSTVDPEEFAFHSRFDICPVKITRSFDQSRIPMLMAEATCACHNGRNVEFYCEPVRSETLLVWGAMESGENVTVCIHYQAIKSVM